MRPSEILAANLNKLMKATPRLETNLKIVQVSCGRLSNGNIGRGISEYITRKPPFPTDKWSW